MPCHFCIPLAWSRVWQKVVSYMYYVFLEITNVWEEARGQGLCLWALGDMKADLSLGRKCRNSVILKKLRET